MRVVAYILGAALLVVLGLNLRLRQAKPAFEILAAPGGTARASAVELPRLWPLPNFSLTERSGQTLTLGDLRGSVWIADFFYTTCPGPCPMLTSRFSDLQKELASETQVRFVSITSDPEKDTPAVLQQYAEHFKAGERWLFLTGDKKAIYSLANDGFKLSLVENPAGAEEPITHSTKLVLVDGTGTVRGVYDGLGEEGKARLLLDTRRLLAERP
jgi:protein SCO1/2